MKVERGNVTPRVSWMRFWTERTEERDMGTAISVSRTAGSVAIADAALLGGGAGAAFGGAGLALLRSRWPSLEMRVD